MTRPAVFLDRDGTLVEEVPYLHDPARLVRLPGVRLDAVLHCPHHPQGTVPAYARACRCRKPGPGLLEAAAERLELDLAASFLVGNHPTDVGAALAAGVTPLYVATGQAAGRPPPPGVASFADLEAATAAVLGRTRGAPGMKRPGPLRP
jgi:histidinol phosphatase-like enzyme